MDGLELRVDDRGLGNRGNVVPVDERAQVLEQRSDVFRRRWHIAGADGVVVVATDPVLRLADGAGDVGVDGEAQQRPVDVFDVSNFEWLGVGAEFDGSFHRFDIAECFRSAEIALPLVRLVGGASKTLVGDVDALDPR